MKIRKSLTACLVFSMLLSGCGSSKMVVTSQIEQKEISLSWWGNDARSEYMLEAVNVFEKMHPDINVSCSYSEWSGYQSRNDVRMVSDTEADVMLINYAWIQQYSPDGDGYYDISKVSDFVDLSNFTDEALDYGIQNGMQNAVPIALNTQTIYINKTIYEKYGLDIPKTWEDFFTAASLMKADGIYPLAMAPKGAWFFAVAYAEQQTGKKFMENDGTLNFTPDDIEIMLKFYCRLINEKVIPQVEYFERLGIENGEYAGVMAWLSDAKNYCEGAIGKGYEIVIGNYATGQNDSLCWYAKPATMYAISKNTQYPEESALLLDFLLNSEECAMLQGIEKGIPISTSARECLEKNEMLNGIQYEAFKKMEEYNDQLSVISPYFETADLQDVFKQACNDVLYEKSDFSDTAKDLCKSFKEILS